MKKFKLLVFDWDGTLMDSIEHIINSLQYAMRKMSIEVLDRHVTKDIIGLGMKESVQTLFPVLAQGKQFISEFVSHYRVNFFDPAQQTALFPGSIQTLETLLSQDYVLAVATSKSRQGLDHVLKTSKLGHYFRTSQCADETRSKPHPDMLNKILDDLKVAPKDAVMIGDSEYDLEMASNAGTVSIAATYGVHPVDRLLKHKPIACLDTISDLPERLASRPSAFV